MLLAFNLHFLPLLLLLPRPHAATTAADVETLIKGNFCFTMKLNPQFCPTQVSAAFQCNLLPKNMQSLCLQGCHCFVSSVHNAIASIQRNAVKFEVSMPILGLVCLTNATAVMQGYPQQEKITVSSFEAAVSQGSLKENPPKTMRLSMPCLSGISDMKLYLTLFSLVGKLFKLQCSRLGHHCYWFTGPITQKSLWPSSKGRGPILNLQICK